MLLPQKCLRIILHKIRKEKSPVTKKIFFVFRENDNEIARIIALFLKLRKTDQNYETLLIPAQIHHRYFAMPAYFYPLRNSLWVNIAVHRGDIGNGF